MLLDKFWYQKHPLRFALFPLSSLFCGLARLRRYLYRSHNRHSWRAPLPVIIVGNISVGGTGKTPLVIHLAQLLTAEGWHPGIVSRGYKGKAQTWPQAVAANSDPRLLGDEPVLMARRSGCPVMIAPRRQLAVEALLPECDVIICDDGLQHYALQRDIEIAVLDGNRGLGNGLCLPAGPLREPPSRLRDVDLRIARGGHILAEHQFHYHLSRLCPLQQPDECQSLTAFQRVHAVAGIGHPQQFFSLLEHAGIQLIPHPFPDHHVYTADDLAFGDNLPIIMTEKDAVKCPALPNAFSVPVDVEVDAEFDAQVLGRLRQVATHQD
jgi:tetraacyldisaccharide 4'-kinase